MCGLSQSDLASKTGLKQVAISLFETGRRAPSFGNLKRLADALEVTTDYLMGRSEFAEVPVEIVSRSFRDERKLYFCHEALPSFCLEYPPLRFACWKKWFGFLSG